ncbi:hypothetical protein D8674_025899 [Pyrus ussuriensis x Pyrus communis]|uniref:Ig-like domain-containing protein n=1 Tax=Pyrus ussuriensis x Pyrus communis TaxID=2448454 RepID=A0A5N5I5A2_9ROSA|nr:hypothetical protein D8674_025899 [Pyrus ussuriensis x Pyrus communis]
MQSSWNCRSAGSLTSEYLISWIMGRRNSTEVLSSLAVSLLWHDLREMANKLFRCSIVISPTKKPVTAIVGGGGSCETMDEAAAITRIKASARERPGLSTGKGGKTN